ncbi:hypothetical protein ACFQ1Y_15505, partial [Virgibacillus alimentarius]
YTEPYVRWCERSTNQVMVSHLLDFFLMNCYSKFSSVTDMEAYKGVFLDIDAFLFPPIHLFTKPRKYIKIIAVIKHSK